MADYTNHTVEARLKLAQDKRTPPEVLETLATDADAIVREAVALNPNTEFWTAAALKSEIEEREMKALYKLLDEM